MVITPVFNRPYRDWAEAATDATTSAGGLLRVLTGQARLPTEELFTLAQDRAAGGRLGQTATGEVPARVTVADGRCQIDAVAPAVFGGGDPRPIMVILDGQKADDRACGGVGDHGCASLYSAAICWRRRKVA